MTPTPENKITDIENCVILKIEYTIVLLKLRIGFLKTRIQFDQFIKKKIKKKIDFTIILIFGYSKHETRIHENKDNSF